MADEYEAQALDLIERIAAMTDDELRNAYLASEGEGPIADAMCVALEARGVDV